MVTLFAGLKAETGSKAVWMFRAEGGSLVPWFRSAKLVAVTFGPPKEFRLPLDERELVAYAEQHYPHLSPAGWRNGARQMRVLIEQMTKDDFVITSDPEKARYWVGTIAGDYCLRPDLYPDAGGQPDFPYAHTREVEWHAWVDKARLSDDTRRKLGPPPTIFRDEDAAAEVIRQATRGDGH